MGFPKLEVLFQALPPPVEKEATKVSTDRTDRSIITTNGLVTAEIFMRLAVITCV